MKAWHSKQTGTLVVQCGKRIGRPWFKLTAFAHRNGLEVSIKLWRWYRVFQFKSELPGEDDAVAFGYDVLHIRTGKIIPRRRGS
jgi:hypothetical protein